MAEPTDRSEFEAWWSTVSRTWGNGQSYKQAAEEAFRAGSGSGHPITYVSGHPASMVNGELRYCDTGDQAEGPCAVERPCARCNRPAVVMAVPDPSWTVDDPQPVERSIDACIADVVGALLAAGIQTRTSCCGHGARPGWILLRDGRQLAIEARRIEDEDG